MSDYKQTRDAAGRVTSTFGKMLEGLTDDDLIDRIETLIAERDEAWKRAAHAEEMWGRAEANLAEQIEWVKQLADDLIAAEGREARLKEKLAKAVEALVELNKVSKRAVKLSQEHDEFRLCAMEPMWQATALANTTLAELTGGKDE